MNIGGNITTTTNPGELRTPITLQSRSVSTETGGFQAPAYNVTLATVLAKWRNVHGSEVWASQMADALAPATVLIRYRADVDYTCIVLLGNKVYEIVSIDDIENRHEYMELKVVYVRSG
jgi:SPP1 family predicted phage head-tail adaptor